MIGSALRCLPPSRCSFVEDLEISLQTQLTKRFESWRPAGKVTRWNSAAKRSLKLVLRRLEREAIGAVPRSDQQGVPAELELTMRSYSLNGFSFNRPYTDADGL